MSTSDQTEHSHRKAVSSAAESNTSQLQKDAPNTPFPAVKLFYLLLAAATLLLVGSVLAYVL